MPHLRRTQTVIGPNGPRTDSQDPWRPGASPTASASKPVATLAHPCGDPEEHLQVHVYQFTPIPIAASYNLLGVATVALFQPRASHGGMCYKIVIRIYCTFF